MTWLGTFGDDPSRVTFVVGDNSITGRIIVHGVEWSFHPLGNGFNALIKLDQTKMPSDGWGMRADQRANKVSDVPVRASKSAAIASTIIDVLVLYTPQSASNIDDEMTSARDLANAALDNSQIDVDVRIIEKVSAGISSEPALNTCDGNPNCNVVLFAQGTLVPNAASLRNQYGADIVVLVSNGGGAKGQATDINAANSDSYIMINKQFASSTTLGHEIGHIIGGNHDFEKGQGYDPSLADFPGGHGYNSDQTWPLGICTMMATGCGRDLYFSTRFQSHQGPSGSVPHGETNCEQEEWPECPTEVVSVWGQRSYTVAGFRASIGGAGGGQDPPAGNHLDTSLEGPAQLGWKDNATLYAGASYQPDDDPCTLCTYEWFERQSGGNWYPLGIFTESYYMTMLWTGGIDYKVRVDDGLDTVEDIHHIDYCSSGCGGEPKRGNVLIDDALPSDYALSEAYPNPFNPTTTISYTVPSESMVTIEVFDLLGHRVETLVDESLTPGSYETTWSAENISSGVYIVRFESAGRLLTRKVILLK